MILLHRLVLAWPNGAQLDIECKTTNAGSPLSSPIALEAFSEAQRERSPDASATPPLCYCPDPDGFYEPIRLREETEYFVSVTTPCSLEDADALWRQSRAEQSAWPFANPRLRTALSIQPSRTWKEVASGGQKSTTVHGSLNFGSFVGTADLTLSVGNRVCVEVACSKLGYYDEFKALLTAVTADFVELLFEIDSATGFHLSGHEPGQVHPSVLLFHLRRLFTQDFVPLAVETIMRQPHSRLSETLELKVPGAARRVDPRRVAQLAPTLKYREGGPAAHLFWGLSPLQLPETERPEDYDTPENRYVKAFLGELSQTCQSLTGMLQKEGKQASLREVQTWEDHVAEWLAWPIWREVGQMSHFPSNSQILLRRPGYREILEADLALDYGVRLPWERGLELAEVVGDLRPVFELYEYWCFFALRRALRTICGPERASSLYDARSDRLYVRLKRGRQSQIDYYYESRSGEAHISLFFNRRFGVGSEDRDYRDESYTTAFRPDFSVLVSAGAQRHWLHFDAKYRLDRQVWERQIDEPTFEQLEEELAASDVQPEIPDSALESGNGSLQPDDENLDMYKRGDLYKMHTYRDALLGARGAYVLFPGTGSESSLFVRHRARHYRDRQEIPSVGAFPLRPSATLIAAPSEQLEVLIEFLRLVFSSLIEADAYQEETGLKYFLPEDQA